MELTPKSFSKCPVCGSENTITDTIFDPNIRVESHARSFCQYCYTLRLVNYSSLNSFSPNQHDINDLNNFIINDLESLPDDETAVYLQTDQNRQPVEVSNLFYLEFNSIKGSLPFSIIKKGTVSRLYLDIINNINIAEFDLAKWRIFLPEHLEIIFFMLDPKEYRLSVYDEDIAHPPFIYNFLSIQQGLNKPMKLDFSATKRVNKNYWAIALSKYGSEDASLKLENETYERNNYIKI